jgi:uncharacterized membrane protein SirB2
LSPLFVVHVTAALVSPALFLLRASRALAGLDPAAGLLRWAPHAVDTVLLAAGITLAARLGQYPFVHGWLTAKVLALVAYIVLGHVAVRRARSHAGRLAALGGALAALLYLYAVAFTRSPLPSIGPV